MRQRFKKSLSFANVIASVALFVSLSGAAYAGGGLDLITGKGIENASITGTDIRDNSITGKQIKEDKLKELDQCSGSTPIDIGDICVGPVQPALTWQGALESCVFNNLRLPDLGEAMLVVAAAQTRSTYIWSSDFVDVPASPAATTRAVARTSPSPTFAVRPSTDLLPYRCVSSPKS